MKKSREKPAGRPGGPDPVEGVRVGRVTHVGSSGNVFVDYAGNSRGPVPARFTGSVRLRALRAAADSGQEVLIVFENGDPSCPIVIDILSSLIDEIAGEEPEVPVLEAEELKDVFIDGKKITFDARDEVVIRCGKGSITLSRDGKIVIKGTSLLSRSSGLHRIKGACVNIN